MKQDITIFFANVRVDTTTISDPVSGRSRPQVMPSVAKQAARRVAYLARMRRDADQGQAAFTAYGSTITYLERGLSGKITNMEPLQQPFIYIAIELD